MAIPKAPIKRIIQDEGAERVSADAVDALVEYLQADAEAIAKDAIKYARYAKRKTVKADDIALAIKTSGTAEAPVENQHKLSDVIKNVFDAAKEGQGIEDIFKSFKKK